MSIATAVRPHINEEFLLGHNAASMETVKGVLALLESQRSITTGEIMAQLKLSRTHTGYILATLGHLGFVDYELLGVEHLYYLTAAGDHLISLEGEEHARYFGAALTESPLAYLALVEGKMATVKYFMSRYGISEKNAITSAETVKSLLRFADPEAIIAHGHPSLHDENYDALYVSHGAHAVVKPEEKLTFCPIHFISLPATGICEDCGGEPEAVAKLTPSMDGKKCDCCATPFERGEKNCAYCAKHSRFCPVPHP